MVPRRVTLALVVGALASAAPALAQVNSPQVAQTAQQASRPYRDVTQSGIARLPEVSFLFTGTKGDKTVEANLGFSVGAFVIDGKLKGVLDDSAPETDLATFRNLSNGTTFDIGVSYLHWSPTADVTRQNEICLLWLRSQAKDLAAAKEIGPQGANAGCTWSQLPKDSFRTMYLNAPTQNRRQEICKQYALGTLQNPDTFECAPLNLPDESLHAQYDAGTNWALPFQIGARYKGGRSKFTWADSSTGEKQSATEDPWEVGIGANILIPTRHLGDLAVSVEYRWQNAFEEKPKRDVCSQLAGTSVTTCQSLAFGRYTQTRQNVVTGIVRKWVGIAAVDLRYSYDTTNNRHFVEVPLYFLNAEGKGLTGGLSGGWSTKDSEGNGGWALRIFIGDVISIWPRPR